MAAPFDPGCIFEVLQRHRVDYVLIGGLAAVLHGSTAMTNDADVMPATTPHNLEALRDALVDLGARLRVAEHPDGLEFEPHPALLASMRVLDLTTRCGDLDVAVRPAGLDDYDAVARNAVTFELDGRTVKVAALADIIRSKETADRPKDRAVLPILRALDDEIRRANG